MNLGKKLVAGVATGAGFLASATPVLAQYDYYYDYTLDSLDATSGAAAGVFGITALLSCCIPLLVLIVSVVLAVIVYKDAQKNKVENPILWALLTLFFSLIGALVYFLAIKPDAVKKLGSTPVKTEEKKEEVK